MKIGMLISSYWPEPEGGAERQCRLLVETLISQGHTCMVFTSRTGRGVTMEETASADVHRFGLFCPIEKTIRRLLLPGDAAVPVHAARFWFTVPFVWLSRLSFLFSLWRFASRHPAFADVLHVHESGWLAGVGVWLGRKWGIPVLCKEATAPALKPVSYGTPFRRYWRKLRKQADAWAAQTENVRGQLVAAGIPADRAHVIPNGVCIPVAASPVRDRDGVLYVGNLTQGAEWKAFDVLFDAWARVVRKRPAASLVFVGGGDPAPWRQALISAGMLESVTFTGRVDDPSCFHAAAGIFLLPSRVEGMSNALLEAQSRGLACVVSDIPGNTAVVHHDINGMVVPVNDAAALAAAVIRLLDDAELRQRLGNGARSHTMCNYGIGSVTGKVIDVYRGLRAKASV